MSRTKPPTRIEGAKWREIAYLWFEVATTHVLMWVANPTGLHSFQPHVHLYLADRYGRSAVAYRSRSRFAVADRMTDKALFHFHLGGGDEPPPAVAVALGRSRQQLVVDAEGVPDSTREEHKILRFIPKRQTDRLETNWRDV